MDMNARAKRIPAGDGVAVPVEDLFEQNQIVADGLLLSLRKLVFI